MISELYYPDQTSTAYFLTKIAEGLATDRSVEVICGPSVDAISPRAELHAGVRIHRVRATSFDKSRIITRLINAFTLTISVFLFSIRHFRKSDTILVVTNPPILPPVVGLIAKLKAGRAIMLVHDVYPEVLVAAGLIAKGGWAQRLLGWLFDRTYRLFDDIVVLGRDMRDLVLRKLDGDGCPVHVIPNWADVEEITPLDQEGNIFARQHGLVGKRVIQFSGNIGRTHDIETILAVAEELREFEDLIFLFVGCGAKAPLVADRAASNVRFLPRQPREMLGPMLACADATIISFVDAMYGVSVPSRMYNILAAGVPIIALAAPQSELALTVEESGAGWAIRPRDRAALAALVRSIHSGVEPSRRERARGAVIPRFTLARVLADYRELIDRPQR